METVEVQIQLREVAGTRAARRLRRQGTIPGIFYGPKSEPVPLKLDRKDFQTRVSGLEGSHLIRMKSEAPSLADKVALVKEMDFHPVTGDVLHVDLYEVDLTAKLRVMVPIHFVGRAAGVVRGGILQPIVREVEVECLPLSIPGFVNLDVSALDIGDTLHITDLPMPEGVEAIYDDNFPLVAVVPPTVEKEPEVEAVAAVEGEEVVAEEAAGEEEEGEKKEPEKEREKKEEASKS